MTQFEPVMYPAAAHTTAGRDGASRRARRIVLATWAAAPASGLVLLAAPSDAQTSTQQEPAWRKRTPPPAPADPSASTLRKPLSSTSSRSTG
jgi:hypothetical protein